MKSIGIIAIAVLSASVASAQTCGEGRWVMTWNDEFDSATLNGAKWRAEDAALVKNNELEYYSPQNVSVANGVLTLLSENRATGGRPYTSGLVETINRFAQQYGRFEVRAKLPKTKGIWPAHWMLPASGGWPPEIDIMELLGHQPSTVYMTNHWGVWPDIHNDSTPYTAPFDFSEDFHTFACEWFPGRIDYFVDGQLRASHHRNIPGEPFYIILNTAVGGDWPGNPDATTVFPQRHEVDHVRVYRYIPAPQSLVNAGWDGGSTLGWTTSGNALASSQLPRTSGFGGKLFGNFTGSANVSVMYQQFDAAPGQTWHYSLWWTHPDWDRLQGGNTASLKIEWRNAANTVVGTTTVAGLTSASPVNIYTRTAGQVNAPANTARARFLVQFSQPATAAGAAYVDDAEFGIADCCPADFSGDGFVTGEDFDLFVAAFELGDFTADADGDGFVTGEDFDLYVSLFEAGC